MKICRTCLISKEIKEFPTSKRRSGSLYQRPDCYSCKYKKEGRIPDKAYYQSYYYNNKIDIKYKAYRHSDKKFYEPTINKDSALELMMKDCFYCGVKESKGLDRKNSNFGHSENNVVPCCEQCNNILGDLSYDAKLLLKTGLTEIRNKGYLDSWIIPTKRKKKL